MTTKEINAFADHTALSATYLIGQNTDDSGGRFPVSEIFALARVSNLDMATYTITTSTVNGSLLFTANGTGGFIFGTGHTTLTGTNTLLLGTNHIGVTGSKCLIVGDDNSRESPNHEEGDYCLIAGQTNYNNSGTHCSISGHYNHTNSGSYCVIVGENNYNNSGAYCSISGFGNNFNSGNSCSISGFSNSTNSGDYCSISGKSVANNQLNYARVHGSAENARIIDLVAQIDSVGTGATVLLLGGSGGTRIVIPDQSAWNVDVRFVAKTATGANASIQNFTGVLVRDGASTTYAAGTTDAGITTIGTTNVTSFTVDADDTNEALELTVACSSGVVRCSARIQLTQVDL